MTKIFFDTEFTGLYQDAKIISLGMYSEDGDMFYAEFNDYEINECEEWVIKNVVSKLKFKNTKFSLHVEKNKTTVKGDTSIVRKHLSNWLSKFEKIEMWGDCLSYDWVLFNQIWGHAFNIPKNIYYIPFDICVLFKCKEIDPDISREEFVKDHIIETEKIEKHNSIWDAYIISLCHKKLMSKTF